MPIKLLIVDDHQLFREGISALFDAELIELIGMASDGNEAVEMVKNLLPDIVLMDISMNGMDGIEATKIILSDETPTRIIGLSMHVDKNYIKEMLEAGASGYLLKNCSHKQLTEAIIAVHSGKMYLSDEITDIVVNDYLAKDTEPANPEFKLSERETEVLMLYADGNSTNEIAEKLFISNKTVATHKQNIIKKTDIKSVADMVKYALKNRLIEL
jgi:two-component system, NarL family, response regulator NreC